MSLDVYLEGPEREEPCICPHCEHEHTAKHVDELFHCNVTHNLRSMADAADIYGALWRPEEDGITRAEQLIEPLRAGLQLLRADPEQFRRYNAPNGWGKYEHLVQFVAEYLAACEAHPDASVRASR